jgi:uncharacterized protein (DUF58 family)
MPTADFQPAIKSPPGETSEAVGSHQVDWKAWQRFLLALFGLSFALLLALEATILRESGQFGLAAASALAALVLAGVVAGGTVPYLARRTALNRLLLGMEYQPTRAGLIYLLVLLAISLAAVNTGNNLLYIVLAGLLAGLIISGIVSSLVLKGIEIELTLPQHVFARRPVPARLTFHNSKRFAPSFAVTLTNAPARRRRPFSSPAHEGREILAHPVHWDHVPRQSSRLRQLELTFPRRGRYAQNGLRLATRFPFGLLVKARIAPLRQEVLVLPAIEPTEEFYEVLPLVSGEVESLAKGRGHDLYAIRDYRESDSARHVDWKATARTHQLKVREFTREDERRVVLVFDPRLPDASALHLAHFEKAVELCACLAWHFSEIDAEMQFVTEGFGTRLERASEVLYPALEALALIEPHFDRERGLLERLSAGPPGFRIVLTSQPRGSIPTPLWSTSYVIFFDSLRTADAHYPES